MPQGFKTTNESCCIPKYRFSLGIQIQILILITLTIFSNTCRIKVSSYESTQ